MNYGFKFESRVINLIKGENALKSVYIGNVGRHVMAKIIENKKGRRLIRMCTEDVFAVAEKFFLLAKSGKEASKIRKAIEKEPFFLPEDL